MTKASKPEAALPEVAAADQTKIIDAWFFDHFHQDAFINNPAAYERATVAKDDLLRLLGLK